MPLLQAENQTDDIQETIEALPGNEVNADQIAEAIMQNMDDQQQQNFNTLFQRGRNCCLARETHYQIMDNLKKSNDVVQDLGYGAYQLMITMIQSGGLSVQDRPDVSAVIIPSGVILMSLAAEFMNESNEFPDITLDQFGDAVEIFTHMMLKHDPEFNQEQEEVPEQQMQEQPQPSGALLNMGG